MSIGLIDKYPTDSFHYDIIMSCGSIGHFEGVFDINISSPYFVKMLHPAYVIFAWTTFKNWVTSNEENKTQ